MNRSLRLYALCTIALLLITGAAWAADPPASSGTTPAILACLDSGDISVLDDQAAMAIRGQEYKYVLVKILGLNALDGGAGVQWTWNPAGYRYGAFGGLDWSNTGADAADKMDALFMLHDLAYADPTADKIAADKALIAGLASLGDTYNTFWGWIYSPADLPKGLTTPTVQVSGVSFFGNKFFFGWRSMPYTEYSRREAITGIGVLVAGRSLLSSLAR
ncbi:MAG: hypothetical protein QUT30_18730 [Acidobacteriota bacterium]|nr:hypothetical protein [Acidobacteriota bacterium]